MSADMIDEVRSWLLARKEGAGDLDLDQDLSDRRIIDSLAFPELLLFLEDLVGRELELTPETAVSFRTLRGIRDHVLVPQEAQ